MGMNREEVYDIINEEREYQDKNYNPDAVTSSGQTRRQRDLEVAPGVLMLQQYAHNAGHTWIRTVGTNLPTLREVAKIAAIAVRILERAGGSEALLTQGLRDKSFSTGPK